MVLLAVLCAPAMARAADYVQAPGSTLAFAGRYQDQVFTGRFPGFSTRVSFDPADPGSATLDVDIPLASATTGNPDYDAQMLGDAFLDAATFAQARYHAEGFRPLGGNRYAADGTLTLHAVSRPVTLEFTWTGGAQPVLAGKATVQRLAFGIGVGDWSDTDLIQDAIAVSTKVRLQPAK
ncbi:YceI family protein [Cognatiluteimonas telluris]|jgi:polyisoprenoid-binding protein YceI|uniref:YceI family protein n=1 Tax=Cognatiluteimonas telluris TaxID=1104775 RepID=UPI00140B49A4|nr:YceI family protein [Lysobacter telluris]